MGIMIMATREGQTTLLETLRHSEDYEVEGTQHRTRSLRLKNGWQGHVDSNVQKAPRRVVSCLQTILSMELLLVLLSVHFAHLMMIFTKDKKDTAFSVWYSTLFLHSLRLLNISTVSNLGILIKSLQPSQSSTQVPLRRLPHIPTSTGSPPPLSVFHTPPALIHNPSPVGPSIKLTTT